MGAIRRRKVAKIETTYANQVAEAKRHTSKRKKRLFRRLSVFFVFATIMMYFVVSAMLAQSATLDEKTATKKALQEELIRLEQEKVMLEEEIIKLNDDEYLAKLARRDYFLSGESEIIFNLPEKKNKESNNDS